MNTGLCSTNSPSTCACFSDENARSRSSGPLTATTSARAPAAMTAFSVLRAISLPPRVGVPKDADRLSLRYHFLEQRHSLALEIGKFLVQAGNVTTGLFKA